MKKLLIALMILISVTSFTKTQEEKRTKACVTVGDCEVCHNTYTIKWPRGETITVWEITASCNGNAHVVIADGWYKEIE